MVLTPLLDPNIIFILADDLGYGDISCYNHSPIVHTPNLDRIAAEGVRMTSAYASPVSSPTRTTFLTGEFPQRSGVYGNHDGTCPGIGPLRHCFVPDLKAEGYNTAWFGKWHQGWSVENHPLANGFDEAYGFLGGMRGTKMTMWEGGIRLPMIARWPGVIPPGTTSSSIVSIVDLAATFIGSARNDEYFRYGDGKNLIPYFKGTDRSNAHDRLVFSLQRQITSRQPREEAYMQVPSKYMEFVGVRAGNWKWVKDETKGINALYNLETDPQERLDLSDKYPEKKKELIGYADSLLSECPESSSSRYSADTRAKGDKYKKDSIINACNNIILKNRNLLKRTVSD